MASLEPSCLAGSPGDTVPGLFCALSILAALRHKDATGMGQRIDIAQTDSLMTLSSLAMVRSFYSDSDAYERARKPSSRIHGVYEAKDGYVVIRVVGEKAVNTVASILGVEPAEITPSSPFLKRWFKERTRHEIAQVLSDKIPCAPVLTEKELFSDPNVLDRGMFVEMPHPKGFTYRTIATGIRFSETPVSIRSLPPSLGSDSVEILKDIGYDDAEIQELIEEKVTKNPHE